MSTLEVRNRMSASALKQSENGNIEFIQNPKTGKLFFACGTKTGYISPKVREAQEAGNLRLEDMQYAECKKPGTNDWVSCLMMRGTANVVASF